jgi:hypothetical protein
MKVNKKLIGGLFLGVMGTFMSVVKIDLYPNEFIVWLIFLLLSIFFLLLFFIKAWHFRNLDSNLPPENYSFLKINFLKTSLIFPYGYFCRHSLVKIGEEINSNRISQLNLNTQTPSFVLDNKEVIFIDYDYRNKFEEFAISNNIKVVDRPDIWKMLCETFNEGVNLDHQTKTNESLIENGFTKNEILQIRKKIKWTMIYASLRDFWDIGDSGHYEYLEYTLFLTRNKYWWTMEIALRNLNKDIIKLTANK